MRVHERLRRIARDLAALHVRHRLRIAWIKTLNGHVDFLTGIRESLLYQIRMGGERGQVTPPHPDGKQKTPEVIRGFSVLR